MDTTEPKAPMCPECQAVIKVEHDVRATEIVVCSDCGSELEVVGINPITLAVAPEIEEDWGE